MTFKKNLPSRIVCETYELAYSGLTLLRKHAGYNPVSSGKEAPEFLEANLHKLPCALVMCLDNNTVCLRIHGQNDPITVKNIRQLIDVLFEAPLKVGQHTVEAKPEGAQVGCTLVPWDTVRKIAALAPVASTVREQHNPDGVSSGAVGEGWRLLDKDEVTFECKRGPGSGMMQYWGHHGEGWSSEHGIIGNSTMRTYRTKLSREELEKARNG